MDYHEQEPVDEKLKREALRAERLKMYMTASIALVGVMLATTVVYTQFASRQRDDRSRYFTERLEYLVEKQTVQVQLLEKRIDDLEKRIQQLENAVNAGKAPAALRLIGDEGQGSAPAHPPAPPPSEPSGKTLFERYVRPSIYLLLGFLLLVSSLVTLATKDASRRETALDFTKTLMSFFIGAATGQV
jgi:hypothetical protein